MIYKIGDIVEVICDKGGHKLEIGEEIILLRPMSGKKNRWFVSSKHRKLFMRESEFKLSNQDEQPRKEQQKLYFQHDTGNMDNDYSDSYCFFLWCLQFN